MRDQYPKHGRRWSVWHPFRWSCRCGMGAYPCLVEQTWARGEADLLADTERLYADGLAYAKEWQIEQRRRWWGGAL